ncbi:MAG: hypothetical protein R3C02_23235 [Planctomycetaceae bacterium]
MKSPSMWTNYRTPPTPRRQPLAYLQEAIVVFTELVDAEVSEDCGRQVCGVTRCLRHSRRWEWWSRGPVLRWLRHRRQGL